MALKKRQKLILRALTELGGEATTKQVAEKTGLHVNGVSQSLGAMPWHVVCLGGRGGETKWQVKKPNMVLHHDDPPCTARLKDGFCPGCKLKPDTQSTCIYLYCPACASPLKDLKCPYCEQTFKAPDQ